jgi:Cu+-exporting ATPase
VDKTAISLEGKVGNTAQTCFHCGDNVFNSDITIEEKRFCCTGCKTVYEIINQNNLCTYYELDVAPGINQNHEHRKGKFDFLDDISIANQLIHFKQENVSHIIFYLPQMHCNSCIWILEKLPQLDKGVLKSTVNFIKKEVTIQFDNELTKLSKIAEKLTDIGYEPHISLNDISKKSLKKIDNTRILKIGIAGFCFGNIMMFSFPEYFSLGKFDEPEFANFFNYFNLFLALPVFFYSASEFFVSALKSYKQKFLNIDTPIALAILITFSRSLYEIISNTGAGYLDSMSGIVFFMLIGRYLQNRTYQQISFERDFTSYFPLGVTRIEKEGKEHQISVKDLKIGDRIKIFNEEIIPADAILFLGKGIIDYSFVTGEATPVSKSIGEIVYAGGRQTNGAIELEVIKEVSQSYLTQLWNNEAFKKKSKSNSDDSFIHKISKYFTYVLFSIAIITAIYWQMVNPAVTLNAITSILIVACPCALLLSATFTNGNMIQQLNNLKFYIKNSSVLERIAKVDTIVFDKTGTITVQQIKNAKFYGEINEYQKELIFSLAAQSNHPLSKAIALSLNNSKKYFVKDYREKSGEGISALIDGKLVKLGAAKFVTNSEINAKSGSQVFISIDAVFLGFFEIQNIYRNQLKNVIQKLIGKYQIAILSGDNNTEKENLEEFFGRESEMRFSQTPTDKLNYIQDLQNHGKVVMMFGDGLNDAGALKQSDVGIAISDNMNNFSPSCDVIMAGENFHQLNELIGFCKKQKVIIFSCFGVSILYNIIGLYFSVIGELKPVIAAILMPASSISIIFITILLSSIFARKFRN